MGHSGMDLGPTTADAAVMREGKATRSDDGRESDDVRLRVQTDARNELDAVCNQVERQLAQLGDAVATHDRSRAELVLGEARRMIEHRSEGLRALRVHTRELRLLLHCLAQGAITADVTAN